MTKLYCLFLILMSGLPTARAQLYDQTYRPQFHFTAKTNWLNDPNGLVFHQGQYHLYFQHNPSGIKWGNMTWGHATSKDLVHWQQLDHALLPDKLGTMFSGSAVVDWNNTAGFGKEAIICIYTAAGGTSDASKGQPFTQCLAYSTDSGRTFTKYDQNPILKHIVGGNRDPKVIWHQPSRRWIMALFLDKNDFAFFASPDLKTWMQLQTITVPDCGECPDFFPMPVDGDQNNIKWVWTAANGRYLVGDFDGQKFTPNSPTALRADWGKNYYAVQTYSDIPASDGRRIQIAWMTGGNYPQMPFNQQMSFPCQMNLRTFPQGLRICRTPVKEIQSLRSKEHTWSDLNLQPGDNPLASLHGDLFEIQAEFAPTSTPTDAPAAQFGLKIRGQAVAYSAKDQKLSCLGASADLPPADGRIKLHILVDRTSLEIFANDGRVALTSCFLPNPNDKSLELYTTGASVRVVSLKVYELRSAW